MREPERGKENVRALAQEIDGVVGFLEGRTVAKQWIRRSAFEKRIEGLERKAKRVKAQNATICSWLRPELRALGRSIRKLRKTATEGRRREANERYVQKRLQNADTDPVLKGPHPAQQRAVVVAEDTQLVLAGAGTGKTQTMAAKVADTLRRGRTTPEHVAVVTFTNKAAKEIRERIGTLAGQPTEGMFVGTIHRLAKQVLMQAPGAGGTRIDAIAEPGSKRYQALKRMLDDLLKADASLHEALAVRVQAHVRIPPSDGKHGEKVRVSLRSGAIDVRSYGEAAICRVLDERGIAFEYEVAYIETPPDKDERKQKPEAAKAKDECLASGYRPDFKITLDGSSVVWLEHWAVDGKGNPPIGVGCGSATQVRRRHAVETPHARPAGNPAGRDGLGPVRASAPRWQGLGRHRGEGHRPRRRPGPRIDRRTVPSQGRRLDAGGGDDPGPGPGSQRMDRGRGALRSRRGRHRKTD